jgi:WXG100 family type VII secretion target
MKNGRKTMADYIEVNIQTLEQDTKDMESAVKQVRGDMDAMFNSVTELDSMWDGPANTAFNQQFNVDKQVFEELCAAIDGIIDSMKNAKDSYRKCEASVSEEIGKINI